MDLAASTSSADPLVTYNCEYRRCQKCTLTLLQAAHLFSDPCACWQFLLRHGVVQCHVRCGKCTHVFAHEVTQGGCRLRCRIVNRKSKRRCRFDVSSLKGTFFEKVRLPMPVVMNFVTLFFVLPPPRQRLIMDELRLPSQTVVDFCSFIREVLVDFAAGRPRLIGGPGIIVEVDEAKIGRRKYNRGRYLTGQWVFGGIERGRRENFFLHAVHDRTAATLMDIIRARIRPGSIIMSDCWRSYEGLSGEGFQHFTVNHSLNFVDPDTGAHTQNIERAWVEVRRLVPRFGRRTAHYEGYLADVLFRKAYPNRADRIHAFWKLAADLYPGLTHP